MKELKDQNLNEIDDDTDLDKVDIKEYKRFQKWQIVSVFLILFDIISIAAAYFFALLVRFDFSYSKIDGVYLNSFLDFYLFYAFVTVVTFQCFKLYNSMWIFASFEELIRLIYANSITIIIHVLGISLIFHRMPLTYYVLGGILQFVITTGIRYSYRFIRLLRANKKSQSYLSKNPSYRSRFSWSYDP